MMSTEGTVIDANADRYFEAVVQNDIENGNYVNKNLVLATKMLQQAEMALCYTETLLIQRNLESQKET